MPAEPTLSLSIPRRTSEALSFCDGTVDGLAEWIESLPMQDPRAAGRSLREALTELNRTHGEFPTRFRQLEALRPSLHFVCSALSTRGGQRALLLDDSEREEALLAQALQFELATGYKIVIVDGLQNGVVLEPGARGQATVVLIAMHRTLTELAQTLLRSLQRYTPPPPRLWEQLHQLYLLAESRDVLDRRIDDPESRVRSRTRIVDAYLRPLMLGAARPNTLRPAMLGTLFNSLEDWTRFVTFAPEEPEDGAHAIVDLTLDAPPRPAAHYRPRSGEILRCVDAERLLTGLERALAGDATASSRTPMQPEGEDTDDLLRHAVHAWGVVTKRMFKRMPVAGRIEVCAGMETIHYHIAGGVEFDDRLAGSQASKRGKTPARFRSFELTLSDASPGGYGLVCEGDFPEGLQTGDLLGVRRAESADWNIAVVRWFGNETDGDARLGIELLAPRAEPAGARLVSARGGSRAWVPVLLLPELSALHQPPALIAPRGNFRMGQKVALNRGGRESKAMLDSSRSFTDNFHQFTLTTLGEAGAGPATGIEVDYLDEADMDRFDLN